MSISLNEQDISVFEYLRSGSKSVGVTSKSLMDYFSKLVAHSSELPLHYQLRLDETLRMNKDMLLDYLAATLRGAVFLLGVSDLKLRGLEYLAAHPQGDQLIKMFQNEEKIQELIDKNFSLHPVLVDSSLHTGMEPVRDVVFVCTEYEKKSLGFVGLLSSDFDLAFGIFKYLNKK
jgi:hypothetical protein